MHYSSFINNHNPSYFSASQESAPRSEQSVKRAAQAEYVTIETGYSPIPSDRRSQITEPKYSILDLKDPSIAPRHFIPPSSDITTNFMLGHFAYENKLGLSSLLASPNFFYQHFTPNSFIASALFPTTSQTFFEDDCHIVTEQTRQDFACNPLLPVIQRKLADYAFAQFGLRRFGQEVFVLSSFTKDPPCWVLSQNINERKLLMQMVTSLNLLGNQLLAKNLSHTVAKLLQHYGNPEARSFFTLKLKDTIDINIKPQQARPVSASQELRKQVFKTQLPAPVAPPPSYFNQSKTLRLKPVQIVAAKPFLPTELIKQPPEFRSTPDLSKLPVNKSLQDSHAGLRQSLEFRSTPNLSKLLLQDSHVKVSSENIHVKTPQKSIFPSVELVGFPRIKSFRRKKQHDVATTDSVTSSYEKNQIIIRAYSLYNQREEFTPQNNYGLKIFEDYSGRANRVFLFKDGEFIGYYDRNKSIDKSTSRDFKRLAQENDDYLVFDIQNNRVIADERKKEHMMTNGAYGILKNMKCIVPSYFISEDRLIVKNIKGENGRDFILNDKKLKPSDFKDLIDELEYCYDTGIYLSDIKFDNIMIDENNVVKFVDTDCVIDISQPDLLPNKLRVPMTRGLTPQILISAIAKLTSDSSLNQIKELLIKSNTYSLLMTMYDFSEGKSIPSIIGDNIIRKNDIKDEYIQDLFHWIDKYFKPEHVNSIKEFVVDPLNKPIGKLSDMLHSVTN